MIPIFDILTDHVSMADIKAMIDDQLIITLPLAYMRGLTIRNSFAMLDEAQNATIKQMHLFLTRIGHGSKMVITGDTRQSDLGPNNGFVDAIKRLEGVEGVEVVRLPANSVVRHPIISKIDAKYNL